MTKLQGHASQLRAPNAFAPQDTKSTKSSGIFFKPSCPSSLFVVKLDCNDDRLKKQLKYLKEERSWKDRLCRYRRHRQRAAVAFELANVSAVTSTSPPKGRKRRVPRCPDAELGEGSRPGSPSSTSSCAPIKKCSTACSVKMASSKAPRQARWSCSTARSVRPRLRKSPTAAEQRVNVIDACMTAVPSVVRQGGLTFSSAARSLVRPRQPHLLNMAKTPCTWDRCGCGDVTSFPKHGHCL